MPDAVRFTANQLRFAAEGADSIRDEVAQLVVREDGSLLAVRTAERVPADRVLFEMFTPSRGPGIPGDAKIEILWRGKRYGATIPYFEKADAVFLTQAAVEKFLLPYYTRFKTPAEIQALENGLFNVAKVIAAFHIPGSITKPVLAVGSIEPDEGADTATSQLY
jgi:hypothetical protein